MGYNVKILTNQRMSEVVFTGREATAMPSDIDIVCRDGEIESVVVEGEVKKITSLEAKNFFEDLKKRYSRSNFDPDDLYDDSKKALDDLIESGFAPCFTVPRQYMDEILASGALNPRETSYQKTVKLTAGTIGLKPYCLNQGRFLVILVDKDYKACGIQPRFTGPVRDTFMFHGVVATQRSIPLSKVIIIDPETKEVVYPSGGTIRVIDRDQEENLAKKFADEIREKVVKIRKAS